MHSSFKEALIITGDLEKTKHISVLNYNDNKVCIIIAPNKSVALEPSIDGEPSTLPLTFDEVKYVNNSRAFKSGLLEFPSDIEDDVYDELRIDKSKVLKLSEIREILITPTKEGLTKIISITSISEFDRVRGQFQKLKYSGHKLTLDVADIIDRRTRELFNNQIKSNIQIGDADVVQSSTDNKRVTELEKQIEEMKLLIAQSMVLQQTQSDKTDISDNSSPTEKETVKKSSGRPKKTD